MRKKQDLNHNTIWQIESQLLGSHPQQRSANRTNKVKSTGSTLTTSFDKPTYVANLTQANIDIVSRFNKYYSYTRWTSQKDHNGYKVNGMNTDGSSNFIRNNSSIYTKRASSNTYFRLGCGPANKGWGGC